MSDPPRVERGPYRADDFKSGDPYEVSRGHRIKCVPKDRSGSSPNGLGGLVLGSDPTVKNAGIDTGLKLAEDTLRAPDIAVNYGEEKPGWVTTAPPLAVEYVSFGTDEDDLLTKIGELLDAGTRWVWVVRLQEPRRVEVYERGQPMRVVDADGELTAPGVLQLPVPVKALYDRDAAHEVTLRNLLARRGYESLDEVRRDGALDATRANLSLVLAARGLALTDAQRERVEACADIATLSAWIRRAVSVEAVDDVFV